MSGPVSFDPQRLMQIASACQSSSGRLTDEAANMKTQLAELQDAVRGIPQIAQADRFDQLNRMLSQLSQALDESNSYVRSIATRVETFVSDLQRGS